MAETERIVEFIFRVRTNGWQDELDAMMGTSQQFDVPASMDVFERGDDGTKFWMHCLPEGSHWRDVTPVEGGWLASVGEQTALYIRSAGSHPFHPAAAELPGGNELSPPQEDPNG